MFDDFAPRLADILTTYSTPIQRGDLVGIFANTSAEPLVKALYEAVLRRGGNPTVFVRLPGLEELFYKIASDWKNSSTRSPATINWTISTPFCWTSSRN